MEIDIAALCTLAHRAGGTIMGVYEGDLQVERKEDNSPLTLADRLSHEVIMSGLRSMTPEIPILSEEGRDIPYSERRQWGRFWLVDPLDGTKEFIKRNGEFTVNIALIEEGRPVSGVVYLPARDVCYFAPYQGRAWRRQGNNRAEPIGVRQGPGEAGLTVVASRSHPSAELEEYLASLRVAERLNVGSSLKFCAVAEGRADLYPRFGPTMEWDTAAGQAIVEAAGGTVRTFDGNRLVYNKPSLLNPFFIVSGAESCLFAKR